MIRVIVTAFAAPSMSLRAFTAKYEWASANAHAMDDMSYSYLDTGACKQVIEDVWFGRGRLEKASGAWCPASGTCLI